MCLLLILLSIRATWAVLLIQGYGLGLAPDEAQYWLWSKDLSLGYYSKPPAIAWQIFASTALLGDSELGVRFGALVLSFFLPLACYSLARSAGLKSTTAFVAALVSAFSPLGLVSCFTATTDNGFLLFWALACVLMMRAIRDGKKPALLLIGLCIALGALFKWAIYFLWIFLLPEGLKNKKKFLLAFSVSVLGLLPSLIWASQNDWVTFHHVYGSLTGGIGRKSPGRNIGDFLGAQVGLFSPVFFFFLLWGIYLSWKRNFQPPALGVCVKLSFLVLLGGSTYALFSKMQPNWLVFCYPTAAVVVAWAAMEATVPKKAYLAFGLLSSCLMIGGAFCIPILQKNSTLSLPYKINPFRQCLGWPEMAQGLDRVGYDPEEHFLFGEKYQVTSALSFYAKGQQRAYWLNLGGARKNHFSFCPSMANEQLGKSGYFVWVENHPLRDDEVEGAKRHFVSTLGSYFSSVQCVGQESLILCNEETAKIALFFKCSGYNGMEPRPVENY